ncbi:hypothetical protein FQA39_LY17779 [Lamprigera yunnana]|nr:hypothetical protein FQA39_LY17779 [Lamprigera yunnana]
MLLLIFTTTILQGAAFVVPERWQVHHPLRLVPLYQEPVYHHRQYRWPYNDENRQEIAFRERQLATYYMLKYWTEEQNRKTCRKDVVPEVSNVIIEIKPIILTMMKDVDLNPSEVVSKLDSSSGNSKIITLPAVTQPMPNIKEVDESLEKDVERNSTFPMRNEELLSTVSIEKVEKNVELSRNEEEPLPTVSIEKVEKNVELPRNEEEPLPTVNIDEVIVKSTTSKSEPDATVDKPNENVKQE